MRRRRRSRSDGMSRASVAGAALLALGLSACSGPEAVTDCTAEGNARPVCGLQNPEDLDLVPGGRYVLDSQLGRPPMKAPGTLALLDEVAKWEPPTPGELFIRALCYDKLQQTKAALEAYRNFLAADQGRNPDQVWQAQQRIIVLKKTLEKKR